MARTLLTAQRIKDAISTSVAKKLGTTAIFKVCSTGGAYIKTTGYDSSKLMILIDRSSKGTGTGTVTIVAGSTGGNPVFSANSTSLNTSITVSSSTGSSRNVFMIGPLETARFKDTDGYIKMNFSSALTTAANSTEAAFVAAIYVD